MDVARQHQDVGLRVGDEQALDPVILGQKLQVEVGGDLDLHVRPISRFDRA